MQLKKITASVMLLLLGLGEGRAQETIPTAGGDATGGGGSSSYTVGQVFYTTNIGTNGSVAKGLQQPYDISISIGIEVTEINLEISAHPNPTNNVLTLTIGNYNNEKLSYQLYDMQGKLFENKQLVNSSKTISMQDLPASTYLLNVIDNNSIIKTFRIVKN